MGAVAVWRNVLGGWREIFLRLFVFSLSPRMGVFLAFFENHLCDSFELGTNVEHPLDAALFFRYGKER